MDLVELRKFKRWARINKDRVFEINGSYCSHCPIAYFIRDKTKSDNVSWAYDIGNCNGKEIKADFLSEIFVKEFDKKDFCMRSGSYTGNDILQTLKEVNL